MHTRLAAHNAGRRNAIRWFFICRARRARAVEVKSLEVAAVAIEFTLASLLLLITLHSLRTVPRTDCDSLRALIATKANQPVVNTSSRMNNCQIVCASVCGYSSQLACNAWIFPRWVECIHALCTAQAIHINIHICGWGSGIKSLTSYISYCCPVRSPEPMFNVSSRAVVTITMSASRAPLSFWATVRYG